MNKTPSEAMTLARALKIKLTDIKKTEMGVCPPFISIPAVVDILKGTKIHIGGQNVYYLKSGAFTGETSASMIKDAGCELVIIGHSERRQFFHETEETVNKKIMVALSENLRPIVCFGETLMERESGKTETVIEQQFTGAMKDLTDSHVRRLVIAYEPVWAIGTGRNATVQQADDVHKWIRSLTAKMFGDGVASELIIQYGGSVKPDNASELLSSENIDGALVGGASLDADSFAGIVKAAENVS
jgi:triosephosphate isomerase (TIM)